jgi:hypothetical protein
MAKVVISQGFIDDLIVVTSNKVLTNIIHTVELLETIPNMGSCDLPRSIREEFGNHAHKIPVNPFDIITLYDETADEVIVVSLIHQRAVW